jgi:hypothetical protein
MRIAGRGQKKASKADAVRNQHVGEEF